MGVSAAGLNVQSDALAGVAGFISVHSAAAGAGGANEISGNGYARQPVVFDAATGGVATDDGTAIDFSGPANQTVAELGLWSALTGGTFYGSDAPTGDTQFNASGEYSVDSATITTTDNT